MNFMEIRLANIADAKRLFDWRNDPLTRAMSRNNEPIAWDQHLAWLTTRLGRPEPKLFIAMVGDHEVGTFRIDEDEISYTIAPDSRGYGFGCEMLTRAREMYGQLRAEILDRNSASIKIAERAGHLVHIL